MFMISAILGSILHVGDIQITTHDTKVTSPSLHIQKTNGQISYVHLIPRNSNFTNISEILVHDITPINKCMEITLPAGKYRAELRGGAGGKPYRCNGGTGTTNLIPDTTSTIFTLNAETTIYALRGGDGNNSGYVNGHRLSGGGASGVDSILVIKDRIIRANGAPGTSCKNTNLIAYPGGGQTVILSGTGGGGGDFSPNGHKINCGQNKTTNCMASGGGGAPNGIVNDTGTNGQIFTATAGQNANEYGGGNGGDVENLIGDATTQNYATGGIGGKNVTYPCGGAFAISYGGGGGGANCLRSKPATCNTIPNAWCYTDCANGGDGGSGSTGYSDTSYIHIYQIG